MKKRIIALVMLALVMVASFGISVSATTKNNVRRTGDKWEYGTGVVNQYSYYNDATGKYFASEGSNYTGHKYDHYARVYNKGGKDSGNVWAKCSTRADAKVGIQLKDCYYYCYR